MIILENLLLLKNGEDGIKGSRNLIKLFVGTEPYNPAESDEMT